MWAEVVEVVEVKVVVVLVKWNSLFYCFQSERREMNLVKRVRGSAV